MRQNSLSWTQKEKGAGGPALGVTRGSRAKAVVATRV